MALARLLGFWHGLGIVKWWRPALLLEEFALLKVKFDDRAVRAIEFVKSNVNSIIFFVWISNTGAQTKVDERLWHNYYSSKWIFCTINILYGIRFYQIVSLWSNLN